MASGIPVGTMVPTPTGPRVIEDIKVGDSVFTVDGSVTKVIEVVPSEQPEDIYALKIKDGREVHCTLDTQFDAYRWTHEKGKRVKKPLLMSLSDILGRDIASHRIGDDNKSHRWNKWHSANCKAVSYPKVDLPVDPYVVGVFLGDGNLGQYTKMLSLSCSRIDEETVAHISELIGAGGYVHVSAQSHNWAFLLSDRYVVSDPKRKYIHVQDVFGDLPEVVHYANEKSIPPQYKYASEEQRWALVQGIMDTDGSIGASETETNRLKKATMKITSTSKQLIDDLAEVIWSLGVEAYISFEDRRGQKYRSAGKTYIRKSVEHTLAIRCSNEDKANFFRLERKKQRAYDVEDTKIRRDYRYQSIVDIYPLDMQEHVINLVVDSPSQSFLAKDFIPIRDAS